MKFGHYSRSITSFKPKVNEVVEVQTLNTDLSYINLPEIGI